jgi:hypothetical protein
MSETAPEAPVPEDEETEALATAWGEAEPVADLDEETETQRHLQSSHEDF